MHQLLHGPGQPPHASQEVGYLTLPRLCRSQRLLLEGEALDDKCTMSAAKVGGAT